MHKLKKNRVQPLFVTDEAWRRYLQYWESEDFQARSRQSTENRNTEVEGPGTGPSKHGGGSVSFVTTQERLADSSETPPTVNDLYLHLHTVNHDKMTFIDTRSERFYDRLRATSEPTRATPEQSVDDEAVYLNVAGESSKGRVYGLGSVGRKKRRYGAPGASTSETPDVVPRPEFNVVAEQLRKVMEFMQHHLGMNVDESYGGAGYLECYDEESGRIDREQHLHAIANEFGKSIKARFSTPGLGGRLGGYGGYSGGSELGGGYGGFGAKWLRLLISVVSLVDFFCLLKKAVPTAVLNDHSIITTVPTVTPQSHNNNKTSFPSQFRLLLVGILLMNMESGRSHRAYIFTDSNRVMRDNRFNMNMVTSILAYGVIVKPYINGRPPWLHL
ncbi:hypothetical protein Syun_009525 [Stephania yunnanensis]|uniref:Uncharacterized protein n=1 Tax=Stephania yunnanensis TaxID=152371 RepID=A0AAP0KEN4_9MAGN